MVRERSATAPTRGGGEAPIPGGHGVDENAGAVLGDVSRKLAAKFDDIWVDTRRTLESDKVFQECVRAGAGARAADRDPRLARRRLRRVDHARRAAGPRRARRPPRPLAADGDPPDRAGAVRPRRPVPDVARQGAGRGDRNALAKADDVRADDLVALITARVAEGRETVDAELMRRHVSLASAEQIQGLLEAYELPESVRRPSPSGSRTRSTSARSGAS